MVECVRRGYSYRVAARRWQVSVATVARWVRRAQGLPLDQVDWNDRASGAPDPVGRTPRGVVAAIKRARRYLQRHDALGEHGPAAIQRYLLDRGIAAPSQRTVARWLAREGLSGTERWRRPPPPKGWYLPEVAARRAELDSCDVVEGLQLWGGRRVEAFNTLSLWGRLPATTTAAAITTDRIIVSLQSHWQQAGSPAFLQCDNDTIFSGAHAQRQYLGRLVHWCLCVGVIPVFTPPCELGFQAAIEAYNRRWQERVWRRWRHRNRVQLQRRSDAFVGAYRERLDPSRACVPRHPWNNPDREPRTDRIVLLRRLDPSGGLVLFTQHIAVAATWANRLVRCEISPLHQHVSFHGLRRRDPQEQPLLFETSIKLRLVPWHR